MKHGRIIINHTFELRTIDRGELFEKAKKLGTDLWPSELSDTKTLLEIFLENGEGTLPKGKTCITL